MVVLWTFAGTLRPVFVFLNTKRLSKTRKLFGSNFFVELKPKYHLQTAKCSTSDLIVAERQLMGSESLDGGIFGSNHLQKLSTSNVCVFRSVFVFRNTKTDRRATAKVRSTTIRPQEFTMILTDT